MEGYEMEGDMGHDDMAEAQASDSAATVLTEVVATGAEIIQQTGDLVVEGVKNTAHILRIDRIPGVKRLFAGYVHQGFYEAYVTIRTRLHQVVHKALCNQPAHVYCTGHSQGGALATLAAIDLAINTIPVVEAELAKHTIKSPTDSPHATTDNLKCSLYIFGSPRVFNLALAQRFDKLIPDSFRVVADGDMVTGLPPFGYKHVGTSVIVDGHGSGSLVIDPSFMERRLRINSKRRLAEHSLNYYRRALEGCEAASRVCFAGADNIKLLIDDGIVRLSSKSSTSFSQLPQHWDDSSVEESASEEKKVDSPS